MTALTRRSLPGLDGRVGTPGYDRDRVTAGVVHFGVGGFHRAHEAMYHDRLLHDGGLEWGVCGVGVLEADRRMQAVLHAQEAGRKYINVASRVLAGK